MKVRKTIYISDQRIIDKLSNTKNQSAYICNLILNDIDNKCRYVTEEKVLQLIHQYINNNINDKVQTVKHINTNDLKESIMSVIDI